MPLKIKLGADKIKMPQNGVKLSLEQLDAVFQTGESHAFEKSERQSSVCHYKLQEVMEYTLKKIILHFN